MAQGYVGQEFWCSFLKNIPQPFNGFPDFEFVIDAYDDADVTITYGSPGDIYYQSQSISLNAGETEVVSFPSQMLNQEDLNIPETKSFHIVSTGDIRLFANHIRVFFSEVSAILPVTALGSEYQVITLQNSEGFLNSLFSIVATEDNTSILVEPTADTFYSSAGTSFTLELNEGEVLTIGSLGDLSGSRITSISGQAIAVFAGHERTQVESGCPADSHLFEQLLPVNSFGDSFALIPVGGNGGDLVRITAAYDNTQVFFNCEEWVELQRNEVFSAFVEDAAFVSSTQPIQVGMFIRSQDCGLLGSGDPNMRVVLPLESANLHIAYRGLEGFNGLIPGEIQLYNVHLVAVTEHIDEISFSGGEINSWQPLPAIEGLSYCRVDAGEITELFTVDSPQPFWAEYVALSGYDARSFAFGTDAIMVLPESEVQAFDLGPDFALCPEQTSTLILPEGVLATWQDGSVSNSYLVEQPGIFFASVNDGCNTFTDQVTVSLGIIPEVNIPSEIPLCNDSIVVVSISPAPGYSYLWSTGDTSASTVVSSPGMLTLTIASDEGCVNQGSSLITLISDPEIELLYEGNCESGSTVVTAVVPNAQAIWPGFSDQNTLITDSSGEYLLQVSNQCETVEQLVLVETEDCSCFIYVPNAFSPNEDGVNDAFRPGIACNLLMYELSIFNRWGDELFFTSDTQDYWFGQSKDGMHFVPDGVYTYRIRYMSSQTPELKERMGHVSLIR